MNITYTKLEIALHSTDKNFIDRLKPLLTEHIVRELDSADSLIDMDRPSVPDFLILDVDDREASLSVLDRIGASEIECCPKIIAFMTELDQNFVFELRNRGADAVILKSRLELQLLGQMERLLEETPESISEKRTLRYMLSKSLRVLLTHSPAEAIHILMTYFVI